MSGENESNPVIEEQVVSEQAQGVETQSQETKVETQEETTQEVVSEQVENQEQEEKPQVDAQKQGEEALEKLDEQPNESKLNYRELIQKFIDGEISDAEKEAIAKSGLPMEQFELMANAQKQIQVQNNTTLYNLVGGEQSYEQLKSFAVEHLSDEEIGAYNAALYSGNMNLARMAVLGLKAMAEEKNGSHPEMRITGDGVSATGVDPYESQDALIKDMNNNKYGRNKEFTEKVNARRAVSGF